MQLHGLQSFLSVAESWEYSFCLCDNTPQVVTQRPGTEEISNKIACDQRQFSDCILTAAPEEGVGDEKQGLEIEATLQKTSSYLMCKIISHVFNFH